MQGRATISEQMPTGMFDQERTKKMSKPDIVGASGERMTTTSEQPIREAQFEVVELSSQRKVGRPVKLTEARFRRIIALIREGQTNNAACRIEGVTYSNWRLHIQRKPEWRAELAEASAQRDEVWRDYALEMVKSAMPKNWAAAMCYLERKHRAEFSLRHLPTESGERAHYDGLTREQVIALLEASKAVDLERPKGLELPAPADSENGTPCSLSPAES